MKPYRLIYVGNNEEFVSIATFLEQLGMQCINKKTGPINNLDFVFIIPEDALDELFPENDPNYLVKLEEVRAMFRS